MKIRQPNQRRGSVLALTPAIVVMLCVFSAFAIDLGYVYTARSDLQSAADASAMAGAIAMRDDGFPSEISDAAASFAEYNAPFAYSANGVDGVERVEILELQDVETGIWDFDSETFTPSVLDNNAVRTTVRRSGGNDSVPLFFMKLFGLDDYGVSASSVVAFESELNPDGSKDWGSMVVVD